MSNKNGMKARLKDKYKFTSHAIEQYAIRFCSSKTSIIKSTKKARNDFKQAVKFDRKNIKHYLKKINFENYEAYGYRKTIQQDFEECFIYKNRVFLVKEKHIVTTVMVSQFIKEEFLPYLNAQIEGFEIKPEVKMI